ncbi:hypothetical protein EE612_021945 [Oryza sativa]|nr:hypothetical protein EE612_021945 [Oryza sativa]KAB8094686.1 hypothetical protein EE612_021945 [Oryza sativa]KAB8094687.1 hypothetical protein EE612_021945 [Oryza sativa]
MAILREFGTIEGMEKPAT